MTKQIYRSIFGAAFFCAVPPALVGAEADSAPVVSPDEGLCLNEVMASNGNTAADVSGNFEDWIELFNGGDDPVSLDGWGLSDDALDPFKWVFPDGAVVGPGEFMLVWASGKDLSRERAVEAGVPAGATWRYHDRGADLGSAWREPGYDDSGWASGPAPLGYGPQDDYVATYIDYGASGTDKHITTYFRGGFEIVDPGEVEALALHLWIDDGAVVFLNGEEIARRNLPSGPVDSLTRTPVAVGLRPEWARVDVPVGSLRAGTNVLAAEVHQNRPTSSDLAFDLRLEMTRWKESLHTNFRIGAEGEEVILTGPDGVRADEVPPVPAGRDVSVGRTREDPDQWTLFAVPTPGSRNAGAEGHRLTESVVFSSTARTFTNRLTVELSGAGEGREIRYTTDGSVPGSGSARYTEPVEVDETTLIRARVFDAAGAAGPVASHHYLRLGADVAARRSRLPQVVLDARGRPMDPDTEIRRDGFFHLFAPGDAGVSALADSPDVATLQGLRWRGRSSLGFPKKPYSVEFQDEAGDDRPLAVLGMARESDWVLYSPYYFDRAFIRNTLMYDLSRSIGRWAPRSRFVEVFYNEDGGDLRAADYRGVYAMVERIKDGPDRLGPENVARRDTPPPGPVDVHAPGPWTGGYVFKIDRSDSDEFVWDTDRGRTLALSRPKLPDLDGSRAETVAEAAVASRQVEYLQGYVQAFEDALEDDRNGAFATRNYLKYIDRDSWVDHFVLNAFAKNVDALRLSAYYHKPRDEKIAAGPLWDFDRSLDSYDGRDDQWDTWSGTGDATRYFEYGWWALLCEDPDFRQAFYDRWAELRETAFSDSALSGRIHALGDAIDASGDGVGSAAVRDAQRWAENSPRGGAYRNEIDHLADWAIRRAGWMDRRRMNGEILPDPPKLAASLRTGEVRFQEVSGSIYYSSGGSDPRDEGGAVAGELYSDPLPVNGPMEIFARVRDMDGAWSTPFRLSATPYFEPRETLVHYWSFNGVTLDPDYTLGGANIAGVFGPDAELTFDTGAEFDGINSRLGRRPREHLRVNTPVDTTLEISLPTGGYEDPVLRFEARRSGQGTALQRIRYTVDGTAYTDWPNPVAVYDRAPELYAFDFSEIPGADDNPDFAVRITFAQGDGGTGGNNRFDNISLEANALPGVNRPPRALASPGPVAAVAGVPVEIEPGDIFSEPDGDETTYEAVAAREDVATARVEGNTLILDGVFQGDTEVRLSASDGVNPPVGILFRVLVYPAPFPLGGGRFVFDSWEPGEPAGRYPEHVLFVQSDRTDPGLDDPLDFAYGIPLSDASSAADADFPYAASSRTRINGLGIAGISFVNTGRGRDLGAAVLSLDTSGVNAAQVTWTAETLEPNTRSYAIRLQHRTGVENAWVDVSDTVGNPLEYVRAEAAGDRVIGPVSLPEELLDEPLVQLRWRYYFVSGDGGPRAELRLDDVIVEAVPREDSYAAWRERTFPDAGDPAISSPSADPGDEGVPNLLRYALGLEGNEPVRSVLPETTVRSGRFGIRFRRDPSNTDIAYLVQASSDLADWSEVLYDSRSDAVTHTDGDFVFVEDPAPVSESAGPRFLRLVVFQK